MDYKNWMNEWIYSWYSSTKQTYQKCVLEFNLNHLFQFLCILFYWLYCTLIVCYNVGPTCSNGLLFCIPLAPTNTQLSLNASSFIAVLPSSSNSRRASSFNLKAADELTTNSRTSEKHRDITCLLKARWGYDSDGFMRFWSSLGFCYRFGRHEREWRFTMCAGDTVCTFLLGGWIVKGCHKH